MKRNGHYASCNRQALTCEASRLRESSQSIAEQPANLSKLQPTCFQTKGIRKLLCPALSGGIPGKKSKEASDSMES